MLVCFGEEAGIGPWENRTEWWGWRPEQSGFRSKCGRTELALALVKKPGFDIKTRVSSMERGLMVWVLFCFFKIRPNLVYY